MRPPAGPNGKAPNPTDVLTPPSPPKTAWNEILHPAF
jgi:hypothetical protein